MSVALRALPSDEASVGDQFVYLRGVTWSDYERLDQLRGDKSVPRLTFDEGVLELMSPSNEHESIGPWIAHLVTVWCEENDVEYSGLGSWTLKNKRKKSGVEPDECFVFGERPSRTSGRRPDLAIEIIWTSGGIDKRDLYHRFGVPELWFWRRGQITIHARRARGYQEVARSEVLPGIDLVELASFLDHPTTSQAKRAYRAALQKKRG